MEQLIHRNGNRTINKNVGSDWMQEYLLKVYKLNYEPENHSCI